MNVLEKVLLGLGITFVVFGLTFALSFIVAWPVMLLWNWLCPVLFGLPVIGYWQAWGLNLLCGLLIKSMNIRAKQG